MNRRNFLSTLGATYVAGNLSYSMEPKDDKSVIFIFLSGGISAIDFINPVPDAPLEVRSNRGAIKIHNGEVIGGDFTNLAKQSKDWTFVRSYHHRDNNHESATYWSMTGEPNFRSKEDNWPSYGSMVSNQKGFSNKGVPTYVQTQRITGDGPAWLGAGHMGYRTDLQGIENLKPKFTKDQLRRRLHITDAIEKNKNHLPKEWVDLREKAVDVIYGQAAAALNLENEPAVDKYSAKTSAFGRDCLLARRLVQAGSSFVTVTNGGWDMHQGISQGFERKAPELDNILTILLDDLKEHGILDKTLIVVTSEFSRTFKINRDAGRDHMSSCNSLLFAGGGFDHGNVIGKTNATANEVVEDEFSPKDLAWTLGNYFGMNKELVLHDHVNRPRPMFQDAKVII